MSFKSALGEIGPAIQQAAGAFANMFANRAERNYQEGVALVAEAKSERDKLIAALASPDVALSPDEQIVADQLMKYYGDLSTMNPNQARAYAQNNPKPVSFRVTKTPVPGTPGTAPEGIEKRGRAFAESSGEQVRGTPGGVSTTTAVEDPSLFLARLQQRGAQGVRQYDMFVTKQGQEAILLRDKQGFDFQLQLADMQMLHDIKMQSGQQEFDRAMADFARQHNLDLAELEHGFRVTEANNAFANTMSRDKAIAMEDRVSQLEADLSDPGKNQAFTVVKLRAIVNDRAVPQETRDYAQALIDGAPVDMAELQAANRNAELAEARARLATADATDETAMALAKAGVRSAEAAADTAEINVDITRQVKTLTGLQIQSVNLANDGQALNNIRERWQFDRDKLLADTSDVGASSAYVQGAIQAGDVGSLEALLLAVQKDPNADPALAGLAVGLTAKTVRDSIELAKQVHENTGLQLDAVKQAVLNDMENGRFNSLRLRSEVIGILGDTYTAEQLENLRDLDPEIARMIDTGQLPMGVVKAAMSKATFRTSVEKSEVNAQPILNINANLDRMAQAPADGDFDTAAEGVRRELQRLVDLGAMDQAAVEGLVAQYRKSWAEQNETTDLNQDSTRQGIAASKAQTEQMLYQVEQGRAAAAAAAAPGQTPVYNRDDMELALKFIESERDEIMGRAKDAGCVVGDMTTAASIASRADCQNFSAQLVDNASELDRVMNLVMQSATGGPLMMTNPETGTTEEFTLGSVEEATSFIAYVLESAANGEEVPAAAGDAVLSSIKLYGMGWVKATFGMNDRQAEAFVASVAGGIPAAVPVEAGAAPLPGATRPRADEPAFANTALGLTSKYLWRFKNQFHPGEAAEQLSTIAQFVTGGVMETPEGAPATNSAEARAARTAATTPPSTTPMIIPTPSSPLGLPGSGPAMPVPRPPATPTPAQATATTTPAPVRSIAPKVALPRNITAQTYRENLSFIDGVVNLDSTFAQGRLRDLARAYGIAIPPTMNPIQPAFLSEAIRNKYGSQ